MIEVEENETSAEAMKRIEREHIDIQVKQLIYLKPPAKSFGPKVVGFQHRPSMMLTNTDLFL